jgi:hypothetical protein
MKQILPRENGVRVNTGNPVNSTFYTYDFEFIDEEEDKVVIVDKSKSFYHFGSRMVQEYGFLDYSDVPRSVRKFLEEEGYVLIKGDR